MGVPGVGDGSSDLRNTGFLPRRDKGLPGCWAVLFVSAEVEHVAWGGDSSLGRINRKLRERGATRPPLAILSA